VSSRDHPHFREALVELYGPALDRAVLFGSRARRDAGEHADYDVAVFLRDVRPGMAEWYRLAGWNADDGDLCQRLWRGRAAKRKTRCRSRSSHSSAAIAALVGVRGISSSHDTSVAGWFANVILNKNHPSHRPNLRGEI
jgi:Polymerase beta, Nucleotidyltransferase